ncbi:hypothetical protein SIN8267_02953 [Sinobacterium norvegicum]|uniref:Uncharacterized protein n=1 Tax=Sinobacterium norvegicum TaxID=1641715 RepID=A0ABM9AID8_9GAMM|nr:hypothetical protein [Sinobacterium norvegicum]CAH0992816.1 hypothetical protein SIN8267_02953 [Sinobacterium norvegicum]
MDYNQYNRDLAQKRQLHSAIEALHLLQSNIDVSPAEYATINLLIQRAQLLSSEINQQINALQREVLATKNQQGAALQ